MLANYFFDSIPQELFYLQNGQIYESLITLTSPQKEVNLDDPEIISCLEISYQDQVTTTDYYDNYEFNRILEYYSKNLEQTNLAFPSLALQCIEHLQQISGDRLLLLSGDKGYSRQDALENRKKPKLALHQGCFSLMVNYHAIAEYVKNQDGQVLTTPHRHANLNICAFLLGNCIRDYIQTEYAYQEEIVKASPDDFFKLKKGIERSYADFSLQELISYLRLSAWDSNIFLDCFSILVARVTEVSEQLKEELYYAIQHIWDAYYFIGEDSDLPFHLSILLYTMGYYSEAIKYLQFSLELYGEDINTFYNLAMCHYRLQDLESALNCIEKTLNLEPSLETAKTMQITLQTEINSLK